MKMNKNLLVIAISLVLISGILFFDAVYGTYGELRIDGQRVGTYRPHRVGDEVEVTYKITNHRFSTTSVDQPYLVVYYRPTMVRVGPPAPGEIVKEEEEKIFESPKSEEKVRIGVWGSKEWKWSFNANSSGSYRIDVGNRLADEYTEEERFKRENFIYVD